jgi:endoglucanase
MSAFRRFGKWIIIFSLLSCFSRAGAQTTFSRGVNLTGWFQVNGARDIQFTLFTEKDIEEIKSLGCDVIRLPIDLRDMISGAPQFKIDTLLFSFLDSAVTWCEKHEMYVILDNHSNTGTVTSVADTLIKVWGQMASHYKNRSGYVLYEVLNEPHGISTASWGNIQGQVINEIRTYDNRHTIVVGGSGWNSYNELQYLPVYADTNLIYTFHFYDPMVFTHQGATWVTPSLAPLSGVPFPYDSDSMPVCPAILKGTWVESNLQNYSNIGTSAWIDELINKAITFRSQRKVRIYCGEFGVYDLNSNNTDRCRWYKVVRQYLENNNIQWTSWDYKGGFGLFTKGSNELFEHDLNVSLLDSLGLNVPPQTPFSIIPDSTGFMLYSDFIGPSIKNASYGSGTIDFYNANLPEAGRFCLNWYGFSQYNALVFDFAPDKDLSGLVNSGYALDFMVRGSAPGILFEMRFRDAKTGNIDHPWRMGTTIEPTSVPWDLRWHHVRIPLTSFTERGAWDNNTWYNPEGKFDWTKVDVFEISTEWIGIIGKDIWFDNIYLSNLDTAIVRVNDATYIYENHAYNDIRVGASPNPMKNFTNITSVIRPENPVNAEVYSITGIKIRTLLKGYISPGPLQIYWDGCGDNGSEVVPGIYFCRIVTKPFVGICRIIKN